MKADLFYGKIVTIKHCILLDWNDSRRKIEYKNTNNQGIGPIVTFCGDYCPDDSCPILGYIPLGFTRATIIHIPVIIGSIILGPKYGAFLGFIFGLTSLVNNTFNPTVTSFVFTPFYSLGTYVGNF